MVGLLDLVKIDQMLQNLKKINTETTALLTDCGHKIFGFTRVIRVLLIISNPLPSFAFITILQPYPHHISMILSFLVKYDFEDSHKSDPKYASAPPISLF